MSKPTEKQRISTVVNFEIRQLHCLYAFLTSLGFDQTFLDKIDEQIVMRGGESATAKKKRFRAFWESNTPASEWDEKFFSKPFGGNKEAQAQAKELRAAFIKQKFGIVS